LQDKAGNLWFGTTGEGVYRYDGKLFYQFTEANGLNSNMVYCLFEDTDGNIWAGTEAGASLYDGKSFSTKKIDMPADFPFLNDTSSKRNDVFNIMQDKSGKIWFATVNGVYVYDGNSFTSFVVNEGVSGFRSEKNNVEHILEDKAGNIWFGGRGNDGVFRYDGESITNLKLEELKGHNWAWPVLQDESGNIWFSNWGGAYRYGGESFTSFTKRDGLCDDIITRIVKSKNGDLLFGCGSKENNDGISSYNGKYFTCLKTKEVLGNNGIWTILEDQSGDLWIGTRNTGLYRYDGETFTKFSDG
jgi:ligand-binding sensor domain-containing protein